MLRELGLANTLHGNPVSSVSTGERVEAQSNSLDVGAPGVAQPRS